MRIVPAASGWRWIREGAQIFARSPVVWMALVFCYWVTLSLVGALPLIGPFVGLVALPACAALFMNVARLTSVGRAVTPPELFAGFRANPRGLLMLGGAYLFAFAAVLSFSALFDGGDLAQYVLNGRRPESESNAGALAAALAYLPVMLAYWFSPALVTWENMSAPKALFYSFYAGWKNWRGFLVYAVICGALVAGGAWLLFTVIQFLAPSALPGAGREAAGGASSFVTFMLTPIILAGLSVLFASFFACYRDIFPEHPPP